MSLRKISKVIIGTIGFFGISLGGLLISQESIFLTDTVYASNIENVYNPTRNNEYRLIGDSLIVYMEDGGTITIINRIDVLRAKMGALPNNIEIINNSGISDKEFHERVVRGHIFGYKGLTSLMDAGIITHADLRASEFFNAGELANPAQHLNYTLDGDTVIVHMENGGTVTIVNVDELIRSVVSGRPLLRDIEIINNSNISDEEFLTRLSRGHVFGYGGLMALHRAGLLENTSSSALSRTEIRQCEDNRANNSKNAPNTPPNNRIIEDVINAIGENNYLDKIHYHAESDFNIVTVELREWRGSISVYVTNENPGTVVYGLGEGWLGDVGIRQEGNVLYISAAGNTHDFLGALGAQPQDIVVVIGVNELVNVSTNSVAVVGKGISIIRLD